MLNEVLLVSGGFLMGLLIGMVFRKPSAKPMNNDVTVPELPVWYVEKRQPRKTVEMGGVTWTVMSAEDAEYGIEPCEEA